MDLSLKPLDKQGTEAFQFGFNPSFGGFISKTHVQKTFFCIVIGVSILRLVDLSLKLKIQRKIVASISVSILRLVDLSLKHL